MVKAKLYTGTSDIILKLTNGFNRKYTSTWLVGVIAIMFIFGLVGIWAIARSSDRAMRDDLLNNTLRVAKATDNIPVSQFQGNESDLSSAVYQELRSHLSIIRQTHQECRFIYMLGKNEEGKLFFFLDVGDDEPALPGQIYDEASDELRAIFDTGEPIVEGPLADEWGDWVSGLVPVADRATGKVIAVLGMDIDAKTWNWDIAARAAMPATLLFAFLFLAITFLILFYLKSGKSLKISEARLQLAEITS